MHFSYSSISKMLLFSHTVSKYVTNEVICIHFSYWLPHWTGQCLKKVAVDFSLPVS